VSTERIAVTGVGAISALATSARATFTRLLAGERAIEPISLFDPGGTRCRIAAEVSGLDVEAIAPRALAGRFTRSDALALLAAREALADAGVGENPGRLGLAIGATTGGMFETENDLIQHPDAPLSTRAARLLSHPLSATAELFGAILPGIVESSTVCSACSSSAVALVRAAAMVRAGTIERALAGGTDGLSRLTFVGFDSLGALDPEPCRPFDVSRRGLNLGEGAAFLVLERESTARARGATILAFFSAGAVTAEAHHVTHPEPSGALAADLLRRALARAGLSPDDVGYVNAHGTGTQQNDAMEARALRAVFGEGVGSVAVSSSKAQLGHTLGAAGALEAAIAVLSLERRLAPPTAGLLQPEDALISHVAGAARAFSRRGVVSCSFGFGGTGSVLVFAGEDSPPPQQLSANKTARVVVTERFAVGRAERDTDPSTQLNPERSRRFDRSAAWPALASSVMLERARLSPAGVGVVLGTAYGSVERSVRFLLRALDAGARLVSPAEFPHLVASAASGNVSIYSGLTGPALTVVDREAPSEHSLGTASLLLRDGHASATIAGAVSPPDPIADAVLRDPVHQRVEGGGFVLLETAASAAARGATALAELVSVRAVALPGAPFELPPPTAAASARVLCGRLSEPALAYLDASRWGECARESSAEDGVHESLTAFAVARAVDRLAAGDAREILIASGVSSVIHLVWLRAPESPA
jgi:3-oxoacyl-[acyl-carrier-protein] synthase II